MPRSSSAAAADSDMIIKDEVVRTLGSELTKLRAAQGQLQTENERLLRELEETRVSLRALEEKQKKRAEAVEDVVPSTVHERILREFEDVIREGSNERAEHRLAMEESAAKYRKLQEKYNSKKESAQAAQAELERLQELTATAVKQLSGAGEYRLGKRKYRADDDSEQGESASTETRSQDRQQEQPQLELPRGKPVPLALPRRIKPPIREPSLTGLSGDALGVRKFLDIRPGDQLSEPQLDRYDQARGNNCWLDIHSKLLKAKLERSFKYCPIESLIWCTRSNVLCMLMHPAHAYVSESRSYKKHDYTEHMRPNTSRDICVSKGGNPATFYYCGTFRCVSTSELTTQDLVKLGMPPQGAWLDALVNNISVFGNFSPPKDGLSRRQFLRQSYSEGKILVRCHMLEYVARNEAVSKIFAECTSSASA
ncbi:hypothetical protein C8Q72DRAFT_854603 [Fomitopsis betulina]|nr:hypothetical protein C8Q72DRAFT_854603 [Fomitopsis betulina]